jgi:hypothetical protein
MSGLQYDLLAVDRHWKKVDFHRAFTEEEAACYKMVKKNLKKSELAGILEV